MREAQLTAITLTRRDSGEADRLAVLLTREEGRVVVVARGARRPRSKLAHLLEPFTLSECRVIHGRGDIATLADGHPIETFRALRAEPIAYARASLLCEAADRGTEAGEAQPALFALLGDCLRRLAEGRDGEAVELYYLLHVAKLAGYAPQFGECAACGAPLPSGNALFEVEAGGMLCDACFPGDAGIALGDEERAAGEGLLRLKLGAALACELPPATLRLLLRVARSHTRHCLDVPLRSLSVLASLEASAL